MKYITWFWWHLPMSRANKESLKNFIFIVFPYIFNRSKPFHNWKDAQLYNSSKGIFLSKPNNIKESPEIHFASRPESILINNQTLYEPIKSLAVIIHAFYYDIFLEIMNYLEKNDTIIFHFYITTQVTLFGKINDYMKTKSYLHTIHVVENRGRDILPFLEITPKALIDGHNLILKIHTKKSDHRQTAKLWRNDIFNKLFKESAVQKAISIFEEDQSVGILGPAGHIVPISLYYGANAKAVKILLSRLGKPVSFLNNMNFIAGSMFYIRKQALEPLLSLGLTSADFEVEIGQLDGTMAHAVERIFPICTSIAGYNMADTTYNSKSSNPNITNDHSFTW